MEASVKARIEQIRERRAAGDESAYSYDDIDLLLSLVKSQEAGRQALAAELLGHLDRITSTTAAYHFVKNICKIELGQEPDSLGAEIDH